MSAARQEMVDANILATLVPLNRMSPDQFGEIAARAKIKQFRKGEYLFREGYSDRHTFYIIKGSVALLSKSEVVKTIDGGTVEASDPLSPELPRHHTARLQSAATIVMIDTSVLDYHLGKHDEINYEVNDIRAEDEVDWMTRVLQSEAFSKLPPINLQRILSGVEEHAYEAGDTVLDQGQHAEYYYIVKNGVCCRDDDSEIEYHCGDGFGAYGLVLTSGQPCRIVMKSGGILMQLHKEAFIKLCYEPLVKKINKKAVREFLDNGHPWLDVRPLSSRLGKSLLNSVAIPYQQLLENVTTLDHSLSYVVIGENPEQACLSAFLLMQHGLNAHAYNEHFDTIDADLIDTENPLSGEAIHELNDALLREQQLKEALLAEKTRLLEEVEQLKKAQGQSTGLSLVSMEEYSASADQQTGASEDDNQRLRQELETLTSTYEQEKEENQRLTLALEEQNGKRQQAENDYKTFLAKVKRYKKNNDTLVAKLKTQLLETKNKLTKLASQSTSVTSDISRVKAELENKSQRLTQTQDQLASAKNQITTLEAALTEAQHQAASLHEASLAGDDNEKIRLLHQKLQASDLEKQAMTLKLKKLHDDYEQLRKEREEAALWEEMEDLQNALGTDSSDVDDLTDLNDLLDDDTNAGDDLSELDLGAL